MQDFMSYEIEKTFENDTFKFMIGNQCGKNWYDVPIVGNSIEMRFIKNEMINKGDIIFDCGAHHGYTSLLFSLWAGEKGHVYSFEPLPENYLILCKNLLLNNVTNVTSYQVALGNNTETCQLLAKSNSMVLRDESGIKVAFNKLDNFYSLKPDFIKIDVEGYEYDLLSGCFNLLNNRTVKIAIEIHTEELSYYGYNIDDLLLLLNIHNYNVWIQWDDNIQPVPYTNEIIKDRVHLFLKPKIERF